MEKKIDEQKEKEKLSNLYMHIKNCKDMAKWLDYRFANSDREFALVEVEDDYLYGRLDGPLFRIEMPTETRMFLKVEDWDAEYEYVIEDLKKVIAPTIWHLGQKGKKTDDYRSEVLRYTFKETDAHIPLNVNVIGYDVKNPKGLIQDILLKAKLGLVRIQHLEVRYPNVTAEEIMYDSLFGTYTGFADEKYIKQINKYSEFELFMAIKSLTEEIAKYGNYLKSLPELPKYDEISQNFTFALAYLIQQVGKFGVKIIPPSFDFVDQPPEFDAWYMWWDEAFSSLLKEKPYIMDEWKGFKNGYDPNFKPKTPFKEYLKAYMELREEEIARLRKEQLASSRKEVVDTLKEVSEVKRTGGDLKVNLMQMVKSLVRRSNDAKEQQETSPYDFM